jgi:VCBS repeat-containing protein
LLSSLLVGDIGHGGDGTGRFTIDIDGWFDIEQDRSLRAVSPLPSGLVLSDRLSVHDAVQ